MLRKFLAVLALAVTGLVTYSAVAAAGDPPYPAPPVVPESPLHPAPSVVPNGVGHTASSTLASTGAGFNVGAIVLIAAIVLMVGAGLIVLGRRLRQSNSR